ncbi:hypothetical protein [Actinoplanes sp. N902-109]|uniref:hypothetical protein n=1 Tax=Actinoplanes sp. (strain N902-109) TaxID=649831 RepID=UPI0003296750|nr:hypothetical protein [Actinoplanes sp. N902-109]AGL16302.1 hypothetical protein L083_2792 [Actinoplanes sp. N902-109]
MPATGGRQRLLISVLVAGTLVAGAAVWVVLSRGAAGPEPTSPAVRAGTVVITRADLSTSRTLHGRLGYGTPQVLKGGRAGIVTSLPRPGQVLKRGAVICRIDDEPVALFYGSPPLYRVLDKPGIVGRDVEMLRANLDALGYTTGQQPRPGTWVSAPDPGAAPAAGGTPAPEQTQTMDGTAAPGSPAPGTTRRVRVRAGDAVLTTALLKAVKRWQADVGMRVDGSVDVGDLAVRPGAVRVDSVTAGIGDSADGPLVSVTRTTKVVTSQIAAPEAASLKGGAAVTMRMPDGTTAKGRISTVANVAASPEGQEAGGPQQVAVTIEPTTKVGLDGGDVDIDVAGETRQNVLTVPVNALLALREGGYALQLPDDRLLPVQTGLFAMGMVEITGDDLAEGLTVVTTS